MPLWFLICYSGISALVIASIYLCHRMASHNRHPFLHPLFYFFVLDTVITLADLLLYFLPLKLLPVFKDRIIYLKYLALLRLFYLIVGAFMVYFFVAAARKVFRQSYGPWFNRLFWGYFALLILIHLLLMVLFFISNESSLLPLLIRYVMPASNFIITIGCLVSGLIRTLQEPDAHAKRFMLFFGLYYASFFTVYNVLYELLGIIGGGYIDLLAMGYNVPMILAIYLYYRKDFAAVAQPAAQGQLDSALGLSKRQLEIVDLVVQGCSNREIEDKLFISRRTVENHIYTIYRRLGIKNRVQLVGLMQQNGPSGETRES